MGIRREMIQIKSQMDNKNVELDELECKISKGHNINVISSIEKDVTEHSAKYLQDVSFNKRVPKDKEQSLIQEGEGILGYRKANFDKLNEFKDKLSSSEDRVEFAEIREEIVKIRDHIKARKNRLKEIVNEILYVGETISLIFRKFADDAYTFGGHLFYKNLHDARKAWGYFAGKTTKYCFNERGKIDVTKVRLLHNFFAKKKTSKTIGSKVCQVQNMCVGKCSTYWDICPRMKAN
jgi:hypothetical protein